MDPIGAALVVSGADDDLVAARLAAALPAEADLVTVVCASPVTGSSELFDVLPDLLGRWLGGSSAGVRLLLLGAAAPVTTETAQRLADDIGQVVVAPIGPVGVGAEARTAAREGWVRCTPGRPPRQEPPWHPAPPWAATLTQGPAWGGRVGEHTIEAVPAGLWLRPAGALDAPGRAADAVQQHPDRLRLIVGDGTRAPIDAGAVADLVAAVPETASEELVILPGGVLPRSGC